MKTFHLVSISRGEEDISRMLPTKAIDSGYQLRWIAPESDNPDPVILIRNGYELYRWDYVPSMGEVWDKFAEL